MSDVTRVLSAIEQGDPQAAEQLLPLVYEELRRLAAQKMAQENPSQTLQVTALSMRRTCDWSMAKKLSTGPVGGTSSPPRPKPCAGFQ